MVVKLKQGLIALVVVIVVVFIANYYDIFAPNSGETRQDEPINSSASTAASGQDHSPNQTRNRDANTNNRTHSNKPVEKDRTTPELAFDYVLDSMRRGDFKTYYDSFSPAGKKEYSEGRILTAEEILKMDAIFKQAGFKNVQFRDKKQRNLGGNVEISGELQTTRNGKLKKEQITMIFGEIDGEWLVSKFIVKPLE